MVVARAVPPEATLNQATVAPAGGVAVSTTVPVPHLVTPGAVGAAGAVVRVALTAVRVAETQPEAVIFAST